MLASAFAVGAPSVLPKAAAANANLFVSAENALYENHFAGPQVIEVVVLDSDIKDTDKGKGEPDVTVNGNKLRMVQATDGQWYAYFADRDQAEIADAVAAGPYGGNDINTAQLIAGNSTDFGTFCAPTTGVVPGVTFTQTQGIAIPSVFTTGLMTGSLTGGAITQGCGAGNGAYNGTTTATIPGAMNVVREAKTINPGSGTTVFIGQITNLYPGKTSSGAISGFWPFIQLYTLQQGGNVVVQYNKGGGSQSTTLTFDTVSQYAKVDLDRAAYPKGSQVHTTLTDVQLNIDPTDEDTWVFQTNPNNATVYYNVFNENGQTIGKGFLANTIAGNETAMMFDHNGILKMNPAKNGGDNIVKIIDNADANVTGSGSASTAVVNVGPGQFVSGTLTTYTTGIGSQPLTFTETAPNTGVFGTYDENDVSALQVVSDAARGKSASYEYNQKSYSVVVGFGTAKVDIQPKDNEWNSGEKIPITVTDTDANKNSKTDEDLDLNNADVPLIPSLRIGTPFTLGANGTEVSAANSRSTIYAKTFTGYSVGHNKQRTDGNFTDVYMTGNIAFHNINVNKFSDRAVIDIDGSSNNGRAGVTGVLISYGKTAGDLRKVVYSTNSSTATASGPRLHGFDYFNYDIRGLSNSAITGVNGSLAVAIGANNRIVTTADTQDVFYAASMFNGSKSNNGNTIGTLQNAQGLINLNETRGGLTRVIAKLYDTTLVPDNKQVGVFFAFNPVQLKSNSDAPVVADFFSFGYLNDGIKDSDRINNMIVRVEVEETGDNTSVFSGTLEYTMLNQINILNNSTYNGLRTVNNEVKFVVHKNLDNEKAPRVNYNDLGADGVVTQVADQQDAPTHSGVVSFDKPTYKKADTVVITLDDQDLNVSPSLIDIYTVVNTTRANDVAEGTVGASGLPTLSNGDPLGKLLYVSFESKLWTFTNNACATALIGNNIDTGLNSAGFTLVETNSASGIFEGTYQVPAQVCRDSSGDLTAPVNAMGMDMEVKYNDFRDASGQITRVGDAAGIRANTGSVSLDRTVYPLPWGSVDDFAQPTDNTAPNGRSIFPVHLTAINSGTAGIQAAKTLGDGILEVHIQVNDPDFDTSGDGEDKIAENSTDSTGANLKKGPVKVSITRGSSSMILAYAGGDTVVNGVIDVDSNNSVYSQIRQLGPITETAPSSGIFEFDLPIEYTDGPASSTCPTTKAGQFDSLTIPNSRGADITRFDKSVANAGNNYCVIQGDIITVEYTDPADASGQTNTVTDSATFDLRNGALQSDKSVYIIGSDMILTLIEPDFDLDNKNAETYDLDLIEWDSDAATVTLGDLSGTTNSAEFDAEPSDFRETGDSTGIFQSVITIPTALSGEGVAGTGKKLNRGEEAVLEYTDWGPSGADYVGEENEKVNLTIFTSNFGATVELDQKVYSWTDKVYITVVAPDHNFDSNLIDTIGNTNTDPLKVATRGAKLTNYKLSETGTDTGIFTGEVILVGFNHDSTGAADGTTGTPSYSLTQTGSGPTGGYLGATNSDGVSVSYEFSEDETVVGSALVRWNIGEVSWLEASYPASGTGVVRVVDPDMNLNPEAVDNFDVNVWSDSDAGGIDLTVTETNEATGIFEGTVFFTTTDDSSGHRLRVAEGDTVTAEYKDNTLPDPYTVSDELDITATSFIGTVVPPLERAPASNPRVVDAFGNTLDSVSVDQQVQITADLTNGQDREQPFAYLVQVQDDNGVTVSLAWITGSLSAGQSFSPALSWVPSTSGQYTATVFVWESVDNPTALSPPESVDITVS